MGMHSVLVSKKTPCSLNAQIFIWCVEHLENVYFPPFKSILNIHKHFAPLFFSLSLTRLSVTFCNKAYLDCMNHFSKDRAKTKENED